MSLAGLHVLLTYRCTFRCDHCFVWGSPDQTLTFTRASLHAALMQAHALGTIEGVYFEGGEPRSQFQPMNANFGLLVPLESPSRDKRQRKTQLAERPLAAIETFAGDVAGVTS